MSWKFTYQSVRLFRVRSRYGMDRQTDDRTHGRERLL